MEQAISTLDPASFLVPFNQSYYDQRGLKKYSRVVLQKARSFAAKLVYMNTTADLGVEFEQIENFDSSSATYQTSGRIANRDELSELAARIFELVSLAARDQPNVVGAFAAAEEAGKMLAVHPLDAPLPTASITADGHIRLRWKDDVKEATVVLEGDGVFGIALGESDKFRAASVDGEIADGFPEVVRSHFSN